MCAVAAEFCASTTWDIFRAFLRVLIHCVSMHVCVCEVCVCVRIVRINFVDEFLKENRVYVHCSCMHMCVCKKCV